MTNVHFCSLFSRRAENEWTETLPHADMVGVVALDLLGLRLRAVVEVGGRGLTVQTCLAVEEGAALLRRAAGLQIPGCRGLSVAWCGWGHVRDLLGVGVLAADLGDASVGSFAGLGEGIVAAVEVLALLQRSLVGIQYFAGLTYLQLVLEQVLLVGMLAIATEEFGLLL